MRKVVVLLLLLVSLAAWALPESKSYGSRGMNSSTPAAYALHTTSSSSVQSYGGSALGDVNGQQGVLAIKPAPTMRSVNRVGETRLNTGAHYSSPVYQIPTEENQVAIRHAGRPGPTTEDESTQRPSVVPLGNAPWLLLFLLAFLWVLRKRPRRA